MDLAKAAGRGAFVLTGGYFVSYIVSFGSTLVLARLLSPNQFGTVALALAIAEFFFLAAAWSLPIALIREPEESVHVAFDTAMILTALLGAGVLFLGLGVAAVIWQIGHARVVAVVFCAIVAGRILALFGSCLIADLERRFRYGRVSLIQVSNQLLAAGASIALAAAGAGVWALAARDIAVSVGMLAMGAWFSSWAPSWRFDPATARRLLSFGTKMIGSRLGEMLFHRYDNLMVGIIAGTRSLGLYNQAYVLAEAGNRVYVPALAYVPMSLYSRLQGDVARTDKAFQLIMFFLTRAIVPIAIVFALFPRELLTVLFGAAWAPAANMLRWLAAYALLLPVFEHVRTLLTANGALKLVLWTRAAQLCVFLPAVPIAVWLWGGVGAGAAVAVAMVIGTGAIFFAARGYARFALTGYVPPLVAGAVAASTTEILHGGLTTPFQRLAVGGIVLLVTYLLSLVALDRGALLRNVRLIVRLLRPDAGRFAEASTPPAQ